jgi:hypothetical protein
MPYLKKDFIVSALPAISLGLFLLSSSPLMAQGVVTAEAVPSNFNPAGGAQITVDINIDVCGTSPPQLLGSFTGTLNWDPAVLSYASHEGPKAGFTGVVSTANVATGALSFNGANPSGAAGRLNIVTITFSVTGANGLTTSLNLEFSALSAALTFTNLHPLLTVSDGAVTVASVTGGGTVIAESVPSNRYPANGEQITVDVNIDMSGTSSAALLGSFTGTVYWNACVLSYVSHTGPKAGFTGAVGTTKTAIGVLSFNGANPAGAGGKLNVLTITFNMVGGSGSGTVLDLRFSAMSAAMTFSNLLPLFISKDGVTAIDSREGATPEMFYLAQNYPNPFNPETTVEFALPKPSHVKLQIYNLLGQPIRTLIDEKIDAGFNSIKWEGRDDGGRQMPSGVYLYQMRAGSFVATRKLVLMR